MQRTLIAAAAAGLIGLPYMVSSPDSSGEPEAVVQEDGGLTPQLKTPQLHTPQLPGPLSATEAKPAAPLAGKPVEDLAELFHFNISTSWILSRWSHVSTVTADRRWKGYRIPLVSGPGRGDLIGSLTYSFDAKQRLRRIEFSGSTGDSGPLVRTLARRHGFRPIPSAQAGLQRYGVLWNEKPVSELRVITPSVVQAGAPHRRYRVQLELNRPQQPARQFRPSKAHMSDLRL